MPKRCFFCTYSRKEKALQIARAKLFKEVNIIEIVKSWRYYQSAIRHLLDERTRLDLKERARYITVDPDLDKRKAAFKRASFKQAQRSVSLRRQNYSDGFFSSQEISELELPKTP